MSFLGEKIGVLIAVINFLVVLDLYTIPLRNLVVNNCFQKSNPLNRVPESLTVSLHHLTQLLVFRHRWVWQRWGWQMWWRSLWWKESWSHGGKGANIQFGHILNPTAQWQKLIGDRVSEWYPHDIKHDYPQIMASQG